MRNGVIGQAIAFIIVTLFLACAERQYTITLKGTITNMPEVIAFAIKKRINLDEVYLQPLLLKEGRYTGRVIEDGKVIFDTDLPRIPLPLDGIFTFSQITLKPGEYLIVAQRLHGDRPFLIKNNRSTVFRLPLSAGSSSVLDLGELYIHLQKP